MAKINIELENFMVELEKRTNTKNFESIKYLINEKAIYWFSDGSFNGLEQIQQAFEKTWENLPDEIYKISDLQWLYTKETSACCIYKFASESGPTGSRKKFIGRGTNVLIKNNGRWQIIHEHLSLEPK